jgi:hypothetical protein
MYLYTYVCLCIFYMYMYKSVHIYYMCLDIRIIERTNNQMIEFNPLTLGNFSLQQIKFEIFGDCLIQGIQQGIYDKNVGF